MNADYLLFVCVRLRHLRAMRFPQIIDLCLAIYHNKPPSSSFLEEEAQEEDITKKSTKIRFLLITVDFYKGKLLTSTFGAVPAG